MLVYIADVPLTF